MRVGPMDVRMWGEGVDRERGQSLDVCVGDKHSLVTRLPSLFGGYTKKSAFFRVAAEKAGKHGEETRTNRSVLGG